VSDFDQAMASFIALRAKTFAALKRVLEADPYCKAYEGRFHITFPDYFDGEAFSLLHPSICWAIALDCYVLGPNRHYAWPGKSLQECVIKAERDIDAWIAEWEQEHKENA
jgi:hypothetical protein